MLAYHSDTSIKRDILKQLRNHAKADELIQGQGWSNGKGCAVGCTMHEYPAHTKYETAFGIPQMLARLEDEIFEGLPNAEAQKWPIQFMSAITPGADLSRVGWQFLHWLLTDVTVNPGITHPLVKEAVKQCADVLSSLAKGAPISQSAAESAAESAERSAARSAAESARSAADAAWSAANAARSAGSAAWSAWSAAESAVNAAYAAWSAAESAAWSAADAAESTADAAESAAESARSAAESAAESAERSAARSAAWSAAWSARSAAESAAESAAKSTAKAAAYCKISTKLLRILRECQP